MFLAGDLERDGALLESVLLVMEGARVATCPSRDPQARPVRLGEIRFDGPSRALPELAPDEP